jgi:hypothetical protein
MGGLIPQLQIKRIPRWLKGFLLGVTLTLLFYALANLAIGWDSRCRAIISGPEEAYYCLPDWAGALLLGLSSGLGSLILLFFYPTSSPLIAQTVTIVITGILASVCYQLAGAKRGMKIFLSIFISIGAILTVVILFFARIG